MGFLRMILSILMAAMVAAVFLLIHFDKIVTVLLIIFIIGGGCLFYVRHNRVSRLNKSTDYTLINNINKIREGNKI